MFKRIVIKAYEKGLVYNEGTLEQVLGQGKYWLRSNKGFSLHDMTKPFFGNLDLDLLLKHETLAELLTVVDVKDDQIAIQYKNEHFCRVLTPGRYAYWKGVMDYTYEVIDLNVMEVSDTISKNLLRRPELSAYIRVYVVESYENGLLYVDGKYEKTLESGIYYFWKGEKAVTVMKADLRKQQVEVSGQELLTKDKAALRINFHANYQIQNLTKAMVETKDYGKQLYVLLQLGLREYIGKYTLDELLANKASATPYILEYVRAKAGELGVEILDCGIRDIILPGEMKEIMNQVLVAEKKAQANVIMRREETASTRSLLNTAKLMEDNEMLYKLKEMEYVEKIAENIQNITLSGGGQFVDQLKTIFSNK